MSNNGPYRSPGPITRSTNPWGAATAVPNDVDVPHFAVEPFFSVQEQREKSYVISNDEGVPLTERQWHTGACEFLNKVHYGVAMLQHFSSFDTMHYYINEMYPEWLFRHDVSGGFPRPKTMNLRSNMTDRFWETVIEHTAASDEARKELEIQQKLRKSGLVGK